jgi:hypothetical protein
MAQVALVLEQDLELDSPSMRRSLPRVKQSSGELGKSVS